MTESRHSVEYINRQGPSQTVHSEKNKGFLIVLVFNNTSTLVGHLMSSPREKEKRDRRDSRGDKRGTGKKEEQK